MRFLTVSKFVLALAGTLASRAAGQGSTDALEFFEKKVRPVLVEHCYKCHSSEAKKPKGGLLLDSRTALLRGGDSGPALVPGQPEKSKLIEALHYKNVDLQMPPRGKLPDKIIADLTMWVRNGAYWPAEKTAASKPLDYALDLARRKKEHWAWQPIRVPTVPSTLGTATATLPVDRFILARLEEKGLGQAAPADARTLLRRLSFDILGLPPTPEEVEAFLRDCGGETVSERALERLVDRLLASPHFGERWGRHWLDLVRYAESRGHEFDYNLPNAYQYRDYVIRALNHDVPYDQFVVEHLAGDLLERPRLHGVEGFDESILGTGFWFLGEQVHSPVDTCQDRADRQDNMIDVMTKTFLGLTVSCARCHDHKFDAISTKDYYGLMGFLESSSYRLACFDSLRHNAKVAQSLNELQRTCGRTLRQALAHELRPGLVRLPDYLLTARAVGKTPIDDAAKDRKLNPAILSRWVKHLATAAKDPRDPFHLWTMLDAEPSRLRSRLSSVIEPKQTDSLPKNAEIIVDYGNCRAEDWIQDGYAFGAGPLRPGDVRLGPDAKRPLEMITRGGAYADRVWDRVKLAPSSENESGALGKMLRSGRTLRTPTFKVNASRVHYLVRGSGMAYASIDGHVMLAGPLHVPLALTFKGGPEFRWISQDVTRYKGSRGHLEFTPEAGSDFAVALVVQCDQPPVPIQQPALLPSLTTDVKSLEEVAQAYGRMYSAVPATLENPGSGGSDARLADWVIRNLELFTPLDNIAHLSGPAFEKQAKVAAEMRAHSRLVPAMWDGTAVNENVFIRGSYKTPGDVVGRRFLEALAGPQPMPVKRGSGRLELARRLVDPANTPFVPRVMVNRIWHHLFGRGIVASVDNFGVLGEPPTHPELLDHLANQFVHEGWSIKKLIRSLVLTRTYRMSSCPDARAMQVDPQNLWLHHARVRRLEGEAIRDAILSVSGRLDRRLFGPPVPVHLTDFQQGRGRPASGPLDGDGRRSIYLSVRRNFLPAMLLAFDTPIPFSTVGRRSASNVPAQALILLNDPFVHQQAEVWSKSIASQPGSIEDRIGRMYLAALGRCPTKVECAACLTFIERQSTLNGSSDAANWKDLAHVLFNAKEFVFLH